MKRAIETQNEGKGKLNVSSYIKELREAMKFLEMDQQFINRYLNQGFSGGEKKRNVKRPYRCFRWQRAGGNT